jgi:hypothetical protein
MKICLPEKKKFSFVKKVRGALNPTLHSVELGVNDRFNPDSWAIKRGLSKVIPHESYNDRTFKNDIALLKLAV